MSGSIDKLTQATWHLRQWLNEDRITNPKLMVTNEDIEHWLKHVKEYIAELERRDDAAKRLVEAIGKLTVSPNDDFWDFREMFELVTERSVTALEEYSKSAYPERSCIECGKPVPESNSARNCHDYCRLEL